MRLRAVRLPKPVTNDDAQQLWAAIKLMDISAFGMLLHEDLQINDDELRFVIHYYDDVDDPSNITELLAHERKH